MSVANARRLRSNPTDAEKRFWAAVRRGGLMGLRFRRQHPVGRYVADFACLDRHLVVEIDGSQHDPHKDAPRTAALEACGYEVIRFTNAEVLTNMEGVLATIADRLGLYDRYMGVAAHAGGVLTPLPNPPPLGEGDERCTLPHQGDGGGRRSGARP
ncbi:MAG TPA: endonuclease domain-containing protein [Azospirillaceae bacterium]|nr:endonuclease domain-containing protein [Azospirillaceae bacterium]